MADTSPDRKVLLNQLAGQFVARYRLGEHPSLQEYCDQHPELAEDIRAFFPTLVEMEQIREDVRPVEDKSVSPAPPIEQLGDFQILREIGHGGMGVVYEAEQVSLGRRVALKLLTQRMLRDANQRRRFEREAKSAARLHHTNIVPVFGSGEHNGIPYYVMQFIKGTGLDVVVDEVARLEGRGIALDSPNSPPDRDVSGAVVARSLVTDEFEASVDQVENAGVMTTAFPDRGDDESDRPRQPSIGTPKHSADTSGVTSSVTRPGQSGVGVGRKSRKLTYWQGVARIGVQVADALEYAHCQGIIHRDVKPSNLLLDLTGTVWVTDFGLAKADGAENLTHTGDILGTLRYMPPEAFEAKADARSDIYSLGLTLYEMLALRRAFDEHDRHKLIKLVTTAEPLRLRKIRREVPRDLETIVHKAINRDPAHRYQTAGDLAADLQRYLDDEPIKARRQTAVEAAGRWARQHKAMATLLTTIGLLLVVVTVGSVALAAYFQQQEAVQSGLVNDKTELAERNRKLAEENEKARETAESALRQAETTLVDMQVSRGQQADDQGNPALAVLWFAKAAKQAASDSQRQAANRLRARNWSHDIVLPVGTFSIGAAPIKMEFCPGNDLLLIGTSARSFVWDWHQEKALPWADGRQQVSAACWSPDGASLALGLPSGEVQIRSVPDGTMLRTLTHKEGIGALAFSPNGRYLATAGTVVTLWDMQSGADLKVGWTHPQPVVAMAFNRKGNRLVTSCLDKRARVFAIVVPTRPTPLFEPVAHVPGASSPPVFVDEDRGLITISSSNQVNWWDAESGKPAGFQVVKTKPYSLQRVVASPKGDSFAVCGSDHAQVWNTVDGGKASLVVEHINIVKDLVFGKNGTTLLTASEDHTARLWSLPNGKPAGDPLLHMGNVTGCAIAGDNKYMATSRFDGQVRIWKQPSSYSDAARYVAWGGRARVSPNGLLLAPGYWHETPVGHSGFERLVVLNARTGEPAGPTIPAPGKVFDSCVCTDNQTLAAVSVDQTVGYLSFWDVPTGRRLFAPAKLPAPPRSVAIRPKSSLAAVLCENDQILLFDFRTGALIQVSQKGTKRGFGWVARAEYTPDGESLVTLTCDGSALHVRQAETGRLRYPPIVPGGFCRSFAISADGKLLATAVNGKNAAQVWDLTTGQAISQRLPHPGDLYGLFHVCFSPDSRFLLTGCKDGQARLWDWKAGVLKCPPLQHQDEVHTVAFSRDGRYALTGSRGEPNAGFHVWELATGKRVAPRIRFPSSVESIVLSPDGTHAFVCLNRGTLVILPLDELLAPPERPTEDFALFGEVGSGHRIELGDVSGLTMEEWLERWGQFRRKYPEYDRPILNEALARSTRHRQTARQLFEAGRSVEAVAMWRKGLVEIDRCASGHPLRAEILNEARSSLENRLAINPKVGEPEKLEMARMLADLLLESREPEEWTVLTPLKMESSGGATLTRLPDNSVLAGGENPDIDTYTIQVRSALQGIRALRLEVFPDPSLPAQGPGRAFNGNFLLNEFSVRFSPADKPQEAKDAKLRKAVATYSQDGYPITSAIDKNSTTGWAIWPQIGTPQSALFEIAEVMNYQQGTDLTITITHQFGEKHTIGKFRISVTARPNCVRNENLIAMTRYLGGWTRLGTAHLVRGDWNLALAAMQKAAASPRNSAADYLLLCLIHEHLGQPALADKDLDEAMKRMPETVSDRLLLELTVDAIAPRIAREPRNPLWSFTRFRWHARLGRPAAALADLEQALKLDPMLTLTPEDLVTLVGVGHSAAMRSEWPLVANAYTHIINRNPESSWIWFRAAIIQAYVGNTKEYRRVCEGMLKKFGETSDPELADRIAKVCLLLPGAIEDRTKVGALAEFASNAKATGISRAWYCFGRGVTEYRVGRFAAAAEWCKKSLEGTPPAELRAAAQYILAMVHHRQGKLAEARKMLAHVVAATPELDGPQRMAGTWHDWLVVYIFRREAEMLIVPKVSPPPRRPVQFFEKTFDPGRDHRPGTCLLCDSFMGGIFQVERGATRTGPWKDKQQEQGMMRQAG